MALKKSGFGAHPFEVLGEYQIAVPSYQDMRIRAMAWVLFPFLLVVVLVALIRIDGGYDQSRQRFINDYQFVFGFEETLRKEYRQGFVSTREAYSEEEYLAFFQGARYQPFVRFAAAMMPWIFLVSLPGGMLLIAVFWPVAPPLLVDRRINRCFTLRRSTLLETAVHPVDINFLAIPRAQGRFNPLLAMSFDRGPLGIVMRSSDIDLTEKKSASFKLEVHIGCYPCLSLDQARDIRQFIIDYTDPSTTAVPSTAVSGSRRHGGLVQHLQSLLMWVSTRVLLPLASRSLISRRKQFLAILREAALKRASLG